MPLLFFVSVPETKVQPHFFLCFQQRKKVRPRTLVGGKDNRRLGHRLRLALCANSSRNAQTAGDRCL